MGSSFSTLREGLLGAGSTICGRFFTNSVLSDISCSDFLCSDLRKKWSFPDSVDCTEPSLCRRSLSAVNEVVEKLLCVGSMDGGITALREISSISLLLSDKSGHAEMETRELLVKEETPESVC